MKTQPMEIDSEQDDEQLVSLNDKGFLKFIEERQRLLLEQSKHSEAVLKEKNDVSR